LYHVYEPTIDYVVIGSLQTPCWRLPASVRARKHPDGRFSDLDLGSGPELAFEAGTGCLQAAEEEEQAALTSRRVSLLSL
jgi:hypothetical protein